MKKSTKLIYIILLLISAILILITAAPIYNKIAVIGVAVVGILALLNTKTID